MSTAPATANGSGLVGPSGKPLIPVVKATPHGFVPASDNLPTTMPLSDPFAAMSGYMESPRTRLGKRGRAQNISFDTLLEMQRHPLILMLMAYQGALLVNAEYTIKCSDAAQRRFFEVMYRNVHRELMLACSPALFFGSVPLVKKFAWEVPTNDDPAPIWQGTVDPVILSGVEQIHPQLARPAWSKTGAFEGIKVQGSKQNVPIPYAFWLTIGKHLAWGDYYGFGRGFSVYYPWWQNQFMDDQQVLNIQRGIDPVARIRHPSGRNEVTGEANSDIAKRIADNMRSGRSLTIPSDTYPALAEQGYESKPSGVRQWDADYVYNEVDITPWLDQLSRSERLMAMAMMIPPQAVLESKSLGLGGPNTAEILGTVAEDTLMIDAASIDDHINKYIFKFLVNSNFGPGAPEVVKETTGLSGRAKEKLQNAWDQLIGQADTDRSIFDWRGINESLDIPLVDEQQAKLAADAAKARQPAPAPVVAPVAAPAAAPVVPPTAPAPAVPAGNGQIGASVASGATQRANPGNLSAHGIAMALRPAGQRVEQYVVDDIMDLLPEGTPIVDVDLETGAGMDDLLALLEGLPDDAPEVSDTEPEADPEPDLFESLTEWSDGEAHVSMLRVLDLLDVDSADRPAAGMTLMLPEWLSRLFASVKKPNETYERALARIMDRTQADINTQLNAWSNGHAPADTIRRIGSILRTGAMDAAILGKLQRTGETEPLSKAERAQVDAWYTEQQTHLRKVYTQIRSKMDEHLPGKKSETTPEQRAEANRLAKQELDHLHEVLKGWRMPLYVNALRGPFEQHRARWAVSRYPRSGDTACLMNCYCNLRWEQDDSGAWVAWWELGKPETVHCPDCPALAAGSPYAEGEL
jgi:hypothetical protein